MRTSTVLVLLLAVACESTDGPDSTGYTDTETDTETDTDAPTPEEEFALLVTESPPGPDNQDPANWGGVLQYTFVESGAPLVPATGIDATELHDPAGLGFRSVSEEMFVGNRHGSISVDGVAGSIHRFVYDPDARTFAASGEITGNGLGAVHQLAFDPATGELFAANYTTGISRFIFDASGAALPNGVIGAGTMRGVTVAPSGTRLYATSAGDDIRQFDLTTGAELPATFVETGAALHFLALHGDELYVAAFSTGRIHRFAVAADDSLTLIDSVDASQPVSIAFSEDGLEMFTAGHKDSDVIQRFAYDATNDTWTLTETVDAGSSLGALLVLE